MRREASHCALITPLDTSQRLGRSKILQNTDRQVSLSVPEFCTYIYVISSIQKVSKNYQRYKGAVKTSVLVSVGEVIFILQRQACILGLGDMTKFQNLL